MATNRVTKTSRSLKRTIGGTSANISRSDYVLEYQWKPDKAYGTVVKLPGGKVFRKATSRMMMRRLITPLTTGSTTFRRLGETWQVNFPKGGYVSDFAIEPQMPTVKSQIKSVTKLCDAPTGIPTEMRNEANTKALLDIVDAKASIGENLATFRQTLAMLHTPSWGLINHVRNAYANRRLRPFLGTPLSVLLKYGKIPKDVAALYLQYVYGVKPLMQDIHGIMKLMKERGSKDFLLYGQGSSNQQCEFRVGEYNGGGSKTRIPTGTEVAKVRTRIWARIDPNCPGLLALSQVGLINPISIAWEVVPFSFVIDWFVPIGSVLQALTAHAGLIFVDGTCSNRFSLTAIVYERAYDAYESNVRAIEATSSVTYQGYYRLALSGWPRPGVYAASNPFGGDRPLKALALAIVNLHRLKKM